MSVPVQQPYQTVVPMIQQPPPQQPTGPRLKVKPIRVLSILQLVIGITTLILGIYSSARIIYGWPNAIYGGIWGGVWIIFTACLGLASAKNPFNGSLNGTHMGFNITSCVVAGITGIIYLAGAIYYNSYNFNYSWNNRNNLGWWVENRYGDVFGVYISLMLLMVAEFVIALVAAVFTCQASTTCCGTPDYSTSSTQVVIAPVHHPVMIQGQQTVAYPVSYPVATSAYTTTTYAGQQQFVAAPNGYQFSQPPPYIPGNNVPMTTNAQPINNTQVAYSQQQQQHHQQQQQETKSSPPSYI